MGQIRHGCVQKKYLTLYKHTILMLYQLIFYFIVLLFIFVVILRSKHILMKVHVYL